MNEYIINNGELYHYGVKGMKWGVQRREESTYSSFFYYYFQCGKTYNKKGSVTTTGPLIFLFLHA